MLSKEGALCRMISSEESLAKLVRAAHEWNVRYIVVGNGSNLLFDDKGYEGVVFLMGQSVDEIKMMNENTIYAEAGCSLIKLCRFALEHNLTGLEFAYGIPGTVGGAIYMNAGAYDGEIKNVITSANSVRADGTVHTTEANKMALAYRLSFALLLIPIRGRWSGCDVHLYRRCLDDFDFRRFGDGHLDVGNIVLFLCCIWIFRRLFVLSSTAFLL